MTVPVRANPARRVAAAFGSWRAGAEQDGRRSPRTAAILGVALGVSFTVCFLTGLYSHLAQHPTGWFHLPASPAGLFRVTQGLHVATGIASIPLLLAKLWAVFPKLFTFPPVRSVAHALERLSLIPLVAGAIFQLWSGVANTNLWYPLPAFFPTAHFWMAWITIGALVTHIGAKVTTTRLALSSSYHDEPAVDPADRRRFLLLAAAGSGLLTALTVGQTLAPAERLALLAPRRPSTAPEGVPVNGTAEEAHVTAGALDPAFRLAVTGAVANELSLSLDDLRAMPQHEATLPIACVEGWSASARWGGVRLRDVLAAAGAPEGASVTVRSIESGSYAQSEVNAGQAAAGDTLLALDMNGAPLSLDHGYPVRLIGPNRPGVMQTKWLRAVEVQA